MQTILPQQNRNTEIRLLESPVITTVLRRAELPALLSDGKREWTAACLGCADRPCMSYTEAELRFDAIRDFPASAETAVCPVGAMVWNPVQNRPEIAAAICMECGLCAARCPVSAIYFADGFRISEEAEGTLCLPDTPEHRSRQREQLAMLQTAVVTGSWFSDCDAQVQRVYQKLQSQRQDAQMQNLLARNSLLGLGFACVLRRRGDVNLRMDALFSCGEQFGVAEIEFRQDALEPPRAILDDIAVLHARYGMEKQTILPLIVHLELPNARTGHWQVVEDIAAVLDIRIRTVTLAALLLLLWHRKPLRLEGNAAFLRQEHRSLRNFLDESGIRSALPEGCCSMLEPEK